MPGLSDAFDAVVQTMARLASNDDEDVAIRVSVAPSFASKWLIPRLDALRRAAPKLEVLVDASARLADLDNDDLDCVVRYGSGAYPELAVDRLFAEAVVPVCSPDFAERHGLQRGPEALLGVPLLHEDGPERDQSCPDWKSWLRGQGSSIRLQETGIRLSQSSLVLDAALAGQGVGLGKLRLAESDIAAGRLVVPFGRPQPVEFSYFFVTTPHKAKLSRVTLFRDWLLAEARAMHGASLATTVEAQSSISVAAE